MLVLLWCVLLLLLVFECGCVEIVGGGGCGDGLGW